MMARALPAPILEVDDVVREYGALKPGLLHGAQRGMRAVDGVSLHVAPGETVAVVGESGCGKSTLLRCIVAVDDLAQGTVRYRGQDVRTMSARCPPTRGAPIVARFR